MEQPNNLTNRTLILIMAAAITLTIFIMLIIFKHRTQEINPLEQRIRESNEALLDSFNSGTKKIIQTFDQGQQVIDNTQTIIKKEQDVYNQFVTNNYILNTLDSTGHDSLWRANMMEHYKREKVGYYQEYIKK